MRAPVRRRSTRRRSARAPTSRASPNPTNLKAELRIAETQTKDIRIGQYAEVDTRNGVVKGKVSRIDPASSNGTVGVDVTLEGALPPGARPDLSVDGTVQLERARTTSSMSAARRSGRRTAR